MSGLGDQNCDVVGMACEPEPIETISLRKYGFTQWTSADGRDFFPAGDTRKVLTPGLYTVGNNPSKGIYFRHEPLVSDDIVKFVDAEADRIVDEMDRFWDAKDAYNKAGLLHKRGVLLYGRQGTGKTYIFRMVIEAVTRRGGICLKYSGNLHWLNEGLKLLRDVQPDIPIAVLLEDIDAIMEDDDESGMINMLDGVDAVEHVVFLASTNHPEQLEGRITNRPSRFDRQIEVGALSDTNRRIYIEHLFAKGEYDTEMIDRVVDDTRGMAVDHVKALVANTFIIGNEYEDALNDIKSMKDKLEIEDGKASPGFSPYPRENEAKTAV